MGGPLPRRLDSRRDREPWPGACVQVTLYGEHKVPCLLFYTRVDDPPLVRAPSGAAPASPGTPVTPPRPLPPLVSASHASPIDEALFTALNDETRQKQWRSFVPFDLPAEAPRAVSGPAADCPSKFVFPLAGRSTRYQLQVQEINQRA